MRHNGYIRPYRQVLIDIQPTDAQSVSHEKVVAAARRALEALRGLPAANVKLYTDVGAEVDAALLEKDDLVYVAFDAADFLPPADAAFQPPARGLIITPGPPLPAGSPHTLVASERRIVSPPPPLRSVGNTILRERVEFI